MTYFESSEEGEKLLINNLKKLSTENFYLVLASHTAVSSEIQELCDYYFYQKKNVVDNRKYSHGVAESNLIEFSLKHLKNVGIDWTYKMTYDVEISDINRFYEWQNNFRWNFVSCNWGDNIICTNSFFSNIDFILENITFYNSIESMFAVNTVLENCWERDIRTKNLISQTFAYENKQVFFGDNKIDILAYNYDNIGFDYNPNDFKFYISNNSLDTNRINFKIFDYYTDLCVFKADDFNFDRGITYWMVPPFFDSLRESKNGFYLEVYYDGKVIRKNVSIRNFDYKHPLSNKFKIYKSENLDNNFGYLSEIEQILSHFNIDLNSISNFIDIGCNCGILSVPFILEDKKVYLIDGDSRMINLLNKNFSFNKNIKIIDKAIYSYNGQIEFLESKFDSKISMISSDDDSNFTKKTIDCITPNELLINYVDEEIVDLIKIDIEGSEYELFRTFDDDILKRVKSFLIEYHINENYRVMNIIEKLTTNGFKFKFKEDGYPIENQSGLIYAWK